MYLISLNVKEKLSKFNLEIYNIDVMENSPLPVGALEIQKKNEDEDVGYVQGKRWRENMFILFCWEIMFVLGG